MTATHLQDNFVIKNGFGNTSQSGPTFDYRGEKESFNGKN